MLGLVPTISMLRPTSRDAAAKRSDLVNKNQHLRPMSRALRALTKRAAR